MRGTTIALSLLGVALSCAPGGASVERERIALHARLAPDAQTLRELEDQIAARTPPVPAESDQSATLSETPDRRSAALTRPKPRTPETPPRVEPEEDPYAELEDEKPFEPDRVFRPLRPWTPPPPPLVPRAESAPPASYTSGLAIARNVALGIGAAGLLVSAVSLVADVDSGSERGEMVGGVALGVGLVGLMTAGILSLTEANQDDATVRVRPSAAVSGVEISF